MRNSGETLNFNVGIFGHVDSGKTALAKALSTTASTAAFDKNPQSKERGITLDLGFSSFVLPVDDSLQPCEEWRRFSGIQVTLVDCPGHASLIRTVIGGAQIIDMVILVVDATKGIQTQTAECLLLAEITCPRNMLIVINKVDMIPAVERPKSLDKLEKRLRKTLQSTKFSDCPFVSLSACPGANSESKPENVDKLISVLKGMIFVPSRSEQGPFLFSVDHCFGIRGQGTIMTGTVLSGGASVGDTVEIPVLREKKKIKSIQVFRQPVQRVLQGDRCGICVTQLEPSQFERGLVCFPDAVSSICAAIVSFNRIPYYKPEIVSKSRFHISIGHSTVMAKCSFFQALDEREKFDFDAEYKFCDEVECTTDSSQLQGMHFALIELDHPVLCPTDSLYIASRLDTDIHSHTCRLAFHGLLIQGFKDKNYVQQNLPYVRVFKRKEKWGTVERMSDEFTVIVHSLFKKETNVEVFTGLKVVLSTDEMGVIEGGFGQSGKVKVRVPDGLHPRTQELLEGVGRKKGKKSDEKPPNTEPIRVKLEYKRFVYDTRKNIVQ